MILDNKSLEKQMARHYELHDSLVESISINYGIGNEGIRAVVKLHPKPNGVVPIGTRITLRFLNVSEFRVWHPESCSFDVVFEGRGAFIENKIWFDFRERLLDSDVKGSVRESELYFVADSIEWEEHIEK